jgi:hypothetical protein
MLRARGKPCTPGVSRSRWSGADLVDSDRPRRNPVVGHRIIRAVIIYQRAVLLVGHRASETATSIAMMLAQLGFAAGGLIGGVVLINWDVLNLPTVAAAFILGTIATALTLRTTIHLALTQAHSIH